MLSIQELRSSTVKELLQELETTRKDMLKIRINVKTKHEKDTSKAQKTKRYIAQILTVLKEAKEEVKNPESPVIRSKTTKDENSGKKSQEKESNKK